MVLEYFSKLFSSQGSRDLELLDLEFRKLFGEQQTFFNAPISREEIEVAVKQLPNTKVPRPDGKHKIFLKRA